MATTSVREALKAAKSQQAVETTPSTPAKKVTEETTKAATVKAAEKPAKKTKAPRVKVDADWLEVLTGKANEHFFDMLNNKNETSVSAHGPAKINFTIANSKGVPVSLTPRVIYEDGAIQSPGPKGRMGFCTDQKFDAWFEKMGDKLKAAMEKEPRVKGQSPTKVSFWTPIAEVVREQLGEGYSVRSSGGRLTIKEIVLEGSDVDWPLQASFKQEEDFVVLSSAKGPLLRAYELFHSVVKVLEESKDTE